MQLSYWEIKNWFSNVDFTIVGSGIVGLHTAIRLRERFPKAKIILLEKGALPQGASTKNAGFACFGSVSEIIDDLKTKINQIQSLNVQSVIFVWKMRHLIKLTRMNVLKITI
jgi:L-2-hydroxyglutarate oxidase LhgO